MFGRKHPALNKRVLINLHNGNAIEGVLFSQRGQYLFVNGATILEPGADPAPATGQIIVETPNVAWIEVT